MKPRFIVACTASIFFTTPAFPTTNHPNSMACLDALAGSPNEDTRAQYYGNTLLTELRKYVRDEKTEFFPGASGFIGDQRSDGIHQDLAAYARLLDQTELKAFKRGCSIAISKINLDDDFDVRVGELVLSLSVQVGATSVFAPLTNLKFPERPTEDLREFLQLTLEFAEGAAELEPVLINPFLRKCLAMPNYFDDESDPARFLVGLTATDPDHFAEYFKLLETGLDRYYGIETKVYPDEVAQRRSYLLEDLRAYVRDEVILRKPLSYPASAAWWALALQSPGSK